MRTEEAIDAKVSSQEIARTRKGKEQVLWWVRE